MSYYNLYKEYKNLEFEDYLKKQTRNDVLRVLSKDNLDIFDFLTLLSPVAAQSDLLEAMARKSSQLTVQNFGKTITMFTPLYLANICENACIYCGFNRNSNAKRSKLSLEDVEAEAKAIKESGMRHVIILTGESRLATPPSYIADCARILSKYLDSVSIEVYSLCEDDYKMLFEAGVDGFTMFQETYNEDIYPTIHPSGPKHDYKRRLESPELACKANFHSVNLGALLGLDDWRRDSFFTALHAKYLIDKYPKTDVAVSLPRIRPTAKGGAFSPVCDVTDLTIVQAMTAYRCFLPRLGITVSTRELPEFRDNIIGLGVTKMSAGSITEVGGHADQAKTEGQFEISDPRSLEELSQAIIQKGYQPVYKDWEVLKSV